VDLDKLLAWPRELLISHDNGRHSRKRRGTMEGRQRRNIDRDREEVGDTGGVVKGDRKQEGPMAAHGPPERKRWAGIGRELGGNRAGMGGQGGAVSTARRGAGVGRGGLVQF
jgi:hypothetical protein